MPVDFDFLKLSEWEPVLIPVIEKHIFVLKLLLNKDTSILPNGIRITKIFNRVFHKLPACVAPLVIQMMNAENMGNGILFFVQCKDCGRLSFADPVDYIDCKKCRGHLQMVAKSDESANQMLFKYDMDPRKPNCICFGQNKPDSLIVKCANPEVGLRLFLDIEAAVNYWLILVSA
jgi:hypothetical protein